MPEKPVNKGFLAHRRLFELYRPRRLRGNIIHHSIHMIHFIHDPAGHLMQHFPRDLRGLRRHEVDGVHRSEGHGVIIGSLIPHDADASHIRKCGEVLAYAFIQSGVRDFFPVDRVCVLHHLNLLFRHFSDNADAKSRARERLAEYQVLRNAKFQSGFPYFVFEQVAQRQ